MMVLLVLEATLVVLLIAKGATIELVVARWKKFSSKLCLLFDPLESRSLHHRRLSKNYNFGTATSYHGLKAVLSKEFAEHETEAVKL